MFIYKLKYWDGCEWGRMVAKVIANTADEAKQLLIEANCKYGRKHDTVYISAWPYRCREEVEADERAYGKDGINPEWIEVIDEEPYPLTPGVISVEKYDY